MVDLLVARETISVDKGFIVVDLLVARETNNVDKGFSVVDLLVAWEKFMLTRVLGGRCSCC